MPIRKSIIILLLLGWAIAMPAQTLIEDGRRLLAALQIVQDSTAPASDRDSAAREALFIVYLYNQPTQTVAPQKIEVDRLLDDLHGNALLRRQMPVEYDNFFRTVPPPASWGNDWNKIQTPGRERITQLMYSGAPLSPVQYLSVQQSLKNNLLPPLQNSTAMRSAADKVKTPLSVNSLQTEALLEGLFNFILERAQQEVAVTFFDQLLNKKIPQIGWLFPNVRERYTNPNITYSQSFLESLREAFFLDLKNLNVTLPELLMNDDYFGELQRDPVFYNLLTVYTIFGLSRNDTPLWESLPLTHSNLYHNYENAGRNLNIQLADSAYESTEYTALIAAANDYIGQLNTVTTQLISIQDEYIDRVSGLQATLTDPSIPRGPLFPINPLYDYQVLIGNADSSSAFDLNLLPQLLDGGLDTATLLEYSSLEYFDKFFATPYTATQLRTSGLELARHLTDGGWYNNLTQVEILRRWQADLSAYVQAVEQWQLAFDTLSLEQQLLAADSVRTSLQQLATDSRNYWQKTGGDKADLQALTMLGYIAASFEDVEVVAALTPADTLRVRRDKIRQIEIRLADIENRLAAANRPASFGSPFQQYLLSDKKIRPIDQVLGQIEKLDESAGKLRSALLQLDNVQAPEARQAWVVPRPMLQVTELLSNLFYAFQKPDGQGLLRLSQLDSMLYEPQLRDVCMGLLQQRISRIKNVGQVSPDALAQFTRLTLEDFLELQPPAGDLTSAAQTDSMRLFKVISVGLQSLNRVLEFPLFADPAKPQSFAPLTVRFPALQFVPDISERCMNFLYYLETKQYRTAVSAMIRLLTSLSKQLDLLEQQKKAKKTEAPDTEANRNYLLGFFENYGDFIAGLVDARDKNEVEYLLKSLADPPGSSRTKRTHRMTAGINAYLGVSVGQEWWKRKQAADTTSRSNFAVVAPSIPVGFTFSRLFFQKSTHPQSFSLHVSVLDLGAMLTYRLADENEFGDYKLTFKNVLKPGVQVQWNVQNSPFYLGLGWQTGAQYRVVEDSEISMRSSRVFISFGIDVPIRTLYAK